MRSVDEHVAAAVALVVPLASERISLSDALGRVTAAKVTAENDWPMFDNSAMDGYAVRSADLASGGVTEMTVAGQIAAGTVPSGGVGPGEAMRIMTGAPVPPGADAVVPIEDTDNGLDVVIARQAVPAGRYVRRRGEDLRAGQGVVAEGVTISAVQVAALTAVGVNEVPVRRRPRVAVLSTGDELLATGEPATADEKPAPGRIPDANTPLLTALLREHGCQVRVLPAVGDDPDALLGRLEGLGDHDVDLLITTGGVSVGDHDVVKAALSDRGVEFVNVTMQPGKPQGLGVVGGVPVVCMPGNPVSVLVTFAVVVVPMLDVLLRREARVAEQAVAAAGWATPPGRRQHMPVRWHGPGQVVPVSGGGSGSHLIASLARAQALAVVPAEVEQVEPGDTVRVMRWTP